MHDGPTFFDNEVVFDAYAAHRTWTGNPNDTIEEPAFLKAVSPVAGLRVLDLGCGDGRFGQVLLGMGAASYLGVEGSARMVAAADAGLTILHARIEDDAAWVGAYDLVVSRLALHYIEDIDATLRSIRACLPVGGRLVMTVEHPVMTCYDTPRDGGRRESWVVDAYFDEGARTMNWLGGEVVKYHRTIESWVAGFQAAGFTVTSLGEPRPDRTLLSDEEYRRRMRIPLFLLLVGVAAA